MKTSILLAQAEEAHHTVVEIPMDPIWYGVITLAVFLFLMFVTMSWKGISHRH
ncbi:hypothetical protein GCM10022261_14870 [Brevibacterium daeguense]|uniref:Uncharacterized protein n=1 Tax=Brevibacterium daeguense TaxID=909936 RepID=A0ABP8EJ16_9MICO|nr:hypothetical protein [Brevibacterium daeguense]